jgi:UDP-N-acetylglucosamine--N-acetylmuramyl-(pentapeptide) pyrophosphoryl-undecaprenol N-acetylglucosamine transferase
VAQGRHRAGTGRAFRLIVTGGGSGGHTYPALATVRALRPRLAAAGRELVVTWAGTAGSLEERVARDELIPFQAIATGKLRRAGNPLLMLTPANVRDMARVPVGVLQARGAVREFGPDAVLATGGYVAIPVGLAAAWCRVPLVVHEQTTRLGLANRVLAGRATVMAVSAESTLNLLPPQAKAAAVVTGNPVRAEVLTGNAGKAAAALRWTGIAPGLPVVYITGGAQGAAQVNDAVTGILPWLLERANVIHQCGAHSVEAVREAAGRLPAALAGRYLVTGFVGPELPDVLALTDVVISRSGAGTIAELTALGKPSVLIPLPTSAGDEQRYNARHLAALGAAVALDGDVTPDTLMAALGPLLADPVRRAAVAAGARAQGRPDAAERLADAVVAAAGHTGALDGGVAAARRLRGLLAGCLVDEPRAGAEGIRVLAPRVGHVSPFGVQAQLGTGAVSSERAEFGEDGTVHGQDQVGPVQHLSGELGAEVAGQVIAEGCGGLDHGGVGGPALVLAGQPGRPYLGAGRAVAGEGRCPQRRAAVVAEADHQHPPRSRPAVAHRSASRSSPATRPASPGPRAGWNGRLST